MKKLLIGAGVVGLLVYPKTSIAIAHGVSYVARKLTYASDKIVVAFHEHEFDDNQD